MRAPLFTNDFNTFKLTNTILQNPVKFDLSATFEEVLEETEVKTPTNKTKKEETSEDIEQIFGLKTKKGKENDKGLPDIQSIIQNNDRREAYRILQSSSPLLDQLKEIKKFNEENNKSGLRQQTMNNAHNFAGQAQTTPISDNGQNKKYSRPQLLSLWEKFTPQITEDITKRSVRIDIPLVYDIQTLVLRLNPDRSVTASMLGSKEMAELIKNNKDRLDKNLRHHHLSLKEFNTYHSELVLNTETGSARKKRKQGKRDGKDLLDAV